jgi:regulator of protease activity HflC (stomatin/prohibitin superfamily)
MTVMMKPSSFSRIKEVVAAWGQIRQLLRSGESGHLVPVVIPRDKRGLRWLFWFALAIYFFGVTLSISTGLALFTFIFFIAIGMVSWWFSAVVEIEEGTTGILSHYGKIQSTLRPGRHKLWWPWQKVEFIVDTSTEIPYTAPVLACPTRENVPLKSIEFFLKFRIVNPVLFVRNIGASNYDMVLSSAVQDAIRRRSRQVETARAYDLRGSDVRDMQSYLNRQMQRYGVQITGANIPDVQLPNQYRENLATQERVAKELVAYEKEWELVRKRRQDILLMEIERAKKERDEKLIMVNEAMNKAREDVARMLQEQETEAEKIRLEIEAQGQAELTAAENEARALNRVGRSYRDNQAVLRYELELRRLTVAERLVLSAPRPVMVNSKNEDGSALSTLILAQILPRALTEAGTGSTTPAVPLRPSALLSSEAEEHLPRLHSGDTEQNGPARGRPRRS